jgi:hypothetical protein
MTEDFGMMLTRIYQSKPNSKKFSPCSFLLGMGVRRGLSVQCRQTARSECNKKCSSLTEALAPIKTFRGISG